MARARILRSMYCPCPGFMYNSLAGEKNVLVRDCLLNDGTTDEDERWTADRAV